MLVTGKGNLTSGHKLLLALLLVGPLLIMAAKYPALPTSEFFVRTFSLSALPATMQSRVMYVLFVPFSAVLINFIRLFLGIRLMGPFRSILLALAFQITGIGPGLIFLAVVVGAIVILRPVLKSIRLPYFARVSVMLSIVAMFILVALLLGELLAVTTLSKMAYFPMIVLCLISEGFAETLSREGLRSALWRGGMTGLVAVLITFLSEMTSLKLLFIRYPELVIIEIGAIVVIAEFFDLRLFKWLNPPAPKKKKSAKSAVTEALEAQPAGEPVAVGESNESIFSGDADDSDSADR
jgi:hypothetical protein